MDCRDGTFARGGAPRGRACGRTTQQAAVKAAAEAELAGAQHDMKAEMEELRRVAQSDLRVPTRPRSCASARRRRNKRRMRP